jgi:hypothetical protein
MPEGLPLVGMKMRLDLYRLKDITITMLGVDVSSDGTDIDILFTTLDPHKVPGPLMFSEMEWPDGDNSLILWQMMRAKRVNSSLYVEATWDLTHGYRLTRGGLSWLSYDEIMRSSAGVMDLEKALLLSLSRGRPKDTGAFRGGNFKVALWEVFGTFDDKPPETQVIERLRQHRLCQRQSSASLENQRRTLLGWLKDAGFENYHVAWREYLLSQKNGK